MLAMVVTLIATVAGAACVTVTGEVGPLHMALGGAPVQLTVNMSWSVAAPPTRESRREYIAACPAFTVAEVEPPGATLIEKSSGAFVVSVSAADVLAAKFESPPYAAVIECDPAASEEVANVATPEAFSVPVLSAVEPSLNVTVPVGVPVLPAAFDTVAVKVTCCPAVTVFAEDVSAVEVACRTLSLTAVEVLAANPAEREGR
jgi:hypothetical protein